MIICHEGLPRSGKSYEAVVYHIIPAIRAGRHVVTNIAGVDHRRIAECAGVSVDRCRELLKVIDWEETKRIHELYEKDGLIVLDELQDFWPQSREKLPKGITEFITQHGHHGLDILVMGQDHRDFHSIWKRRIENRIVFLKRSAIGKEDSYLWTLFKQKPGEKWDKITSGTRKYEEQYFGTYKSHSEGTENKGNYKDDRANIFSNKSLRYGVPVVVLGAFWAVFYLWSWFHGNNGIAKSAQAKPAAPSQVAELQARERAQNPAKAQAAQPEAPPKPEYLDYLDKKLSEYRPRLSALVFGMVGGVEKVAGYVEFLDSGYRAQERLGLDQIEALGWKVTREAYGVRLTKQKKEYIVTAWPVEPFGAVAEHTKESPAITGERVFVVGGAG